MRERFCSCQPLQVVLHHLRRPPPTTDRWYLLINSLYLRLKVPVLILKIEIESAYGVFYENVVIAFSDAL